MKLDSILLSHLLCLSLDLVGVPNKILLKWPIKGLFRQFGPFQHLDPSVKTGPNRHAHRGMRRGVPSCLQLAFLHCHPILVAHPEKVKLGLGPLVVGLIGFRTARRGTARDKLPPKSGRQAGLHKRRGCIPVAADPGVFNALLFHSSHHLGNSLAFLTVGAINIHIE
jgi:hypothetical protein